MTLSVFQVPAGFVEGMLEHWRPDRQVFRFGTHELTPTLEEYARLTMLPLDRPCVHMALGDMSRRFMTLTGLRRKVV